MLQAPRANLLPHRQPFVLPLSPLKAPSVPSLFLHPSHTASASQDSILAGFYTRHLAAVCEHLCLGQVSAMQQPWAMRQANITHVVLLCSLGQLRAAASPEQLTTAEVLYWLLTDAPLAQAVKSCQAVGALVKLVPLAEQVSWLPLLYALELLH